VTSDDGGRNWSDPEKLPAGILGPIKNKPIQLEDGTLLSPTSTEHDGWEIQLERSTDLGKSWSSSGSLNEGKEIGAIQPTILKYQDRRMQLLSRTENGYISECWSEDGGITWGEMRLTSLLNPNSGIDAVTLNDWRQLLVFNPTGGDWGARVPLSLAVSKDGISWKQLFDLEPVTNPDTVDDEEYSYPGVIQSTDGLVHVVYTWNRKTIKHVVIDPKKMEL
ncbi:exo-alpha-sialidase, partial [bacterium]|nr:exo-alpha-sialidase [bacterium]